MRENEAIELAKLFTECRKGALDVPQKCFKPNCSEKAVACHILQKNGILSSIAPDRHVWEHRINFFKDPNFSFEKRGISQAFAFPCFCKFHDNNLFKRIESKTIDFSDYQSCLLFTLRTIYNEIWRKEVNLRMYNLFLKKRPDVFNQPRFMETIRQEELGLQDLRVSENEIWSDYEGKTRSFLFMHRQMEKVEICLSSFFNYETLDEMRSHLISTGKDMDSTSDLFVNLFPWNGKSILLMGYKLKDEKKVKGYINAFFKESEKRTLRKLTNLLLFKCETWVVSSKFYVERIKGVEDVFSDAVTFSVYHSNDRKIFDINICSSDFQKKFIIWHKQYFKLLDGC